MIQKNNASIRHHQLKRWKKTFLGPQGSSSRSQNFAYFRDLVVLFFGEGLAFLTGELFSADLNATFLAGAFLAGVALVFLAGCVVVDCDLVFLAGDSSFISAAFLLPRVGFSTGVSALTGLSAFLVPRVLVLLTGVSSFLGSSATVFPLLPRVGFSIEVSTF